MNPSNFNKTIRNVLTDQYFNQYCIIKDHVESLWKCHSGLVWHTLHNTLHSNKVVELIFELIPKKTHKGSNVFTNKEWFYLLSSAWLHDIGMIKGLLKENDSYEIIRINHHERSVKYIKKNRIQMRLDQSDVLILSKICQYHRRHKNILECEELFDDVRIRLVAAYLRLADGLHIDKSRVPESTYELLKAADMPWENRFHWMKSQWVISVKPDFQNNKIVINVIDDKLNNNEKSILSEAIERDITEELYGIKDVLIKGDITFYLEVDTITIPPALEKEERINYELVRSHIEIEQLSSASKVASTISKILLKIIEYMPALEAYPVVKDYIKQVENLLSDRPSHILIQNILNLIKKYTENNNLLKEEIENNLLSLKESVSKKMNMERHNLSALANNAMPFLIDGGNIFLFGFSTTIISSLDVLPNAKKQSTIIYVGEGREKTKYSSINETAYCDGLNYAIELKKIGFKHIYIIPDISIGNLMERKMVAKVFFGANCITSECKFLQSSGHLSIAIIANKYEIPVYVIVDTSKFGELIYDDKAERKVNWFSADYKTKTELNKYGIKTFNPRDDIVDQCDVSMIITEEGAFPPAQVPQIIRSEYNNHILVPR